MKFKWEAEENEVVFSQTMTRERFSCEEKWGDWKNDFFNEEDPFTLKILNDKEFILSSKIEDYQERWIRIK